MNTPDQLRIVLAIGWEQEQAPLSIGEPRHFHSVVLQRADTHEAQLASLAAAFEEAKALFQERETSLRQPVLCVSHTDEGKVFVFGEGIYVGDRIPGPEAAGMGLLMHQRKTLNPTIQLDSGEVIYGCECWWGPLEAANAKYANLARVNVSITDARAQAAAATAFAEAVKVGDRVIITSELTRPADSAIIPAGTEAEVVEIINDGEAARLRVAAAEGAEPIEVVAALDGLRFAREVEIDCNPASNG